MTWAHPVGLLGKLLLYTLGVLGYLYLVILCLHEYFPQGTQIPSNQGSSKFNLVSSVQWHIVGHQKYILNEQILILAGHEEAGVVWQEESGVIKAGAPPGAWMVGVDGVYQ